MKTIAQRLEEAFTRGIQRAFDLPLAADITQSTNPHFGHYQCNSALKIGKELAMSPRGAAQKLLDATGPLPEVEKLEIAGPGFINITLSRSFLNHHLMALAKDPRLGIPLATPKKKIVIDFSSPNVAKELHVGHLRSTIIGDCLARVLEFLGHDVLRLNHIGDWGTQFGMLIAYLETHTLPKEAALPDLMEWYRAAKKQFDDDPAFKKRAQQAVVALQAKEPKAYALWEKICAISQKAFHEIYSLLDVTLIDRGESSYNDALADTVALFERQGLVTVSDGAKCLFLEGFDVPLIIQKSDGGYNYATTDLTALRQRIEEEKADRIIYVVDAGQALHFKMVFQAAAQAGFLDTSKVTVDHVAFGVVLGTDGKKFKTRSGEVERLIDLITQAIDRARLLLKERTESVSEETAHILGINAIKYADLSCSRLKDYTFSYDRMLRFEGNTAPFLLYAYVRVQGIKRKINRPIDSDAAITLEHTSEIALALHLTQFAETIAHLEQDLLPHRLTDYLYLLAEKFHAFYRDCPVEGQELEQSRLHLSELTAKILATGLHLLGLKTLDRM